MGKRKKMTKYIDREQALSHPFANGKYDHKNANEDFIIGFESYKEWIEQLPPADVVEVIRCKDCKHSFGYTTGYGLYGGLICEALDRDVDDEFFCSYGERRGVDKSN